jgi:hypothetical protein
MQIFHSKPIKNMVSHEMVKHKDVRYSL